MANQARSPVGGAENTTGPEPPSTSAGPQGFYSSGASSRDERASSAFQFCGFRANWAIGRRSFVGR